MDGINGKTQGQIQGQIPGDSLVGYAANGAVDSHIEDLFIQALELEEEERHRFIQQLDPAERSQVTQLLAEFTQFDSLVEEQAITVSGSLTGTHKKDPLTHSFSATQTFRGEGNVLPPIAEPTRVGPFAIIEKIGQGGMGTVYLARQEKPRRNVALKIIPRRQVGELFQARFEAEYQALAMMSHNHIARLYAAGSTDDGNAYFCMEYIQGIPITTFCKENKLTIPQRLDLFRQVCAGMQHAHQKAIVHRDLKPSNILVCMEDNKPTAKIIDFGLAKGLVNPLSEKPLQTQAGTLAGTPAYMSPEQLVGNPEQVDTRGDVYALGIILYELLANTHPFDLEKLRELPLDEALGTLRKSVPPRPSVKLKKETGQQLHTDLDHITLKAIAKSLSNRYPSVYALREDIDNFLNHRPIMARGYSKIDVFVKFIRRNRIFFTASGLALLALLTGFGVAVHSSIKASRARAQTEEVFELVLRTMAAPNPSAEGREVKVVDILENMEERLQGDKLAPHQEAALRNSLGISYFGLGLYPEARTHLQRAWELQRDLLGENDPGTLRSRFYLARAMQRTVNVDESIHHYEATIKAQKSKLGELHPHTLQAMSGLAMAYRLNNQYEEAEILFREVLTKQRKTLGSEHKDTLASLVGLANSCHFVGKCDEAVSYYHEALAIQVENDPADAPTTLATKHDLANCLLIQKDWEKSERLFRELVRDRERVLGPNHSETTSSLYGLGRCLFTQERYPEAAQVFGDIIIRRRVQLGPYHEASLRAVNMLALSYRRDGHLEHALGVYESLVKQVPGRNEVLTDTFLQSVQNLGDLYLTLERYPEAIEMLKAVAARTQSPARNIVLYRALAYSYEGIGDIEQSFQYYCRALELARVTQPNKPDTALMEQDFQNFLEVHQL